MIDEEVDGVYIPNLAPIERIDRSKTQDLSFYFNEHALRVEKAMGAQILETGLDFQTTELLRKLLERDETLNQENITIFSTNDIVCARDSVDSPEGVYSSIFIIDTFRQRRYFILAQEYSKGAFFEYLDTRLDLNDFAKQFRNHEKIYDEKDALNLEIKVVVGKNNKPGDLKI